MRKDAITFRCCYSTFWHWPRCQVQKYTFIAYPVIYNLHTNVQFSYTSETKIQPQLIATLSFFRINVISKSLNFMKWQTANDVMVSFPVFPPPFPEEQRRSTRMLSQETRFPKHDPPPRHQVRVLATEFDIQCCPFKLYNMLNKPWRQAWQQVDFRLGSCRDVS